MSFHIRDWIEDYALPDEVEYLGDTARSFLPLVMRNSFDDILCMILAPKYLKAGLEAVFGREHALTKLAHGAIVDPDAIVAAWREAAALPKAKLQEVLMAARERQDPWSWDQ